jgi:hypothetical protein
MIQNIPYIYIFFFYFFPFDVDVNIEMYSKFNGKSIFLWANKSSFVKTSRTFVGTCKFYSNRIMCMYRSREKI